MKKHAEKLIPPRSYHASPRLTHAFKRKLRSEVALCFVNRDFIKLITITLEKLPIKDKLPCLYYFLKLAKQEVRQADPEWVYINQEQYDNYMWAIRDEQRHFEPVKWINAEIEETVALANLPTESVVNAIEGINETAPAFDPELVPERKLIEMLGMSKSTLGRLRSTGLPFQKIGKPVFYNLNEVKKWLRKKVA